jgi:tetratricopeptide (TPR) repeat protein
MAGQTARAEAAWKRVLEIDPDHARALYELGSSAGRAGRYAEAERYLKEAVRAKPDDPKALVTLAMVLDERGDWPAAAHYYRAFLSLGADLGGSYREHARARLAEGPLGGRR